MGDFLTDVFRHVENYYYGLVNLTPKIGLAIIVLLLSWFLATKIQQFSDRRLKRRMHDPLLANFISRILKSILIVIGIFLVLRIIGLTTIAQSLLAGAGISAFIIGFALKDIGENFLAGILLAFKRPFSIGDMIECNGVRGKVTALNLRDTQIKSDGKDIYIPNAQLLNNTLINYNSEGYLLQDFTIGLEYGSDYQRAIDLTKKALEDEVDVINEKLETSAVITGAVGTAIQLQVRYWVQTDAEMANGHTKSKVMISVLKVLKENGFSLRKD